MKVKVDKLDFTPSDTVKCCKCKHSIPRAKLLESLKLMKNGSYGIKGQCYICGHFICWIPKKLSAVYGKLYQIERGR